MHVLPGLLMVKIMLPLFENISMWGGKFYRKVGRNGFQFFVSLESNLWVAVSPPLLFRALVLILKVQCMLGKG